MSVNKKYYPENAQYVQMTDEAVKLCATRVWSER